MADISKITLPSGTTYNIKDQGARDLIETLSSPTSYLGVTSTEITDGSTVSPIVIGDKTVTPKSGDIAAYGNSEFIWSGTEGKWREFGSTGSLGDLAFKDSASASYTPAGAVSQPTFTGTKATISANYTPAGTVAAPTVTVTANTASVKPFGSAGTLPSFTASVSGETLSLSFSAGTLPTAGTAVTVATGIKSATASAPAFTGTKATISADYTPAGSVSKPTFTGTAATITAK